MADLKPDTPSVASDSEETLSVDSVTDESIPIEGAIISEPEPIETGFDSSENLELEGENSHEIAQSKEAIGEIEPLEELAQDDENVFLDDELEEDLDFLDEDTFDEYDDNLQDFISENEEINHSQNKNFEASASILDRIKFPRGKFKKNKEEIVQFSEIHAEENNPRSLEEISQELETLLLHKSELAEKLSIAAKNAEDAENASQDFAKFASNAESSIAWRLKSKFNENLNTVSKDLDNVVKAAEAIKLEDVGLLNKLKQVFLRRFWISVFIAALVIGIFFVIRAILKDSTAEFAIFLNEIPELQIVAIVLSFWLSSFFGLIVAYYKTWSQYERNLQVAEVELAWVRTALQVAQESKHKLTKLYDHTEQWVTLISMSLLHPWQTDEKWEASSGSVLSDEKLPNCVTVAQAVEGTAGAMAALERTAAARLLRPGWREQVFLRQILALAKHLGIQQGKFDYETLDKDSPSVPNGSRSMYMENFQHKDVQTAVARSYLSELGVEVQTVGLLESKPPVKNDYVDDLDVIAEDLDLLGEVEIEQSWDGFLLEIVGEYNDPIIPISPLSFTDRAVIENVHGSPSVHIQMPSRLKTLIGELDNSRISISAHSDSARLPLDLVVRVDAVGPLEPNSLKIWSNDTQAHQLGTPNPTNPKNRNRCSTCGREDCSSLGPDTNGTCTNTGV